MSYPLLAISVGLAALTLWGVISPRTQWRALVNRSGSAGSEPSAFAIGILRAVSVLALATLAFGVIVRHDWIGHTPTVERSVTDPVRLMWGSPDPVVVDRVITPADTPPTGLVPFPVVGYQPVEGSHRSPVYLFSLQDYSRPHATSKEGYIGAPPSVGLSALDTSDLVVQVRADSRCIPQQAVVTETSATVVVTVYYGEPKGLPDAASLPACDPAAKAAKSTSMLLAFDLAKPLGDRFVVSADGTQVPLVTTRLKTPTPTPTPTKAK